MLDFFKLNFGCLLSVVEVLLLAFILFQYYNCVSEMSKCFSYFVPCYKCASWYQQWGIWVLKQDKREFISYCSVSCVTVAVGNNSFLGSSFNFSRTTSSDVRHITYFPTNEIKGSLVSTAQREAFLDCTSQVIRSSGISFCIIQCSLHCQVWRARRVFGVVPTPPCAFYISAQLSWPTWSGHHCVLMIALSLYFTGLNKTLLKRERKAGWGALSIRPLQSHVRL